MSACPYWPDNSRLCVETDDRISTFLNRPLEGDRPYISLDTTYLKQHRDGRTVSVAAIIAAGINNDGQHEVTDLDVCTTGFQGGHFRASSRLEVVRTAHLLRQAAAEPSGGPASLPHPARLCVIQVEDGTRSWANGQSATLIRAKGMNSTYGKLALEGAS